MSILRKIIFASIVTAASAGVSNSQNSQFCKYVPGNPDVLDHPNAARQNFPPGFCMAGVWPRVQPGLWFDLTEYGAVVTILPKDSPDAAKQELGKYPKKGANVGYGDGGFETIEDPRHKDMRVRSDNEYQNPRRPRGWTIEELMVPAYGTTFTCGNLIVSVGANPSKGAAARDLVKELDSNLQAAGLCGSSSSGAGSTNSSKTFGGQTEGGYKVFDGEVARQIKEAAKINSRYVVSIDTHWDAQQGCWVEERSFAGGIRGSDDDRVSVAIGPSKAFCLNGSVYSTAQLNSAYSAIGKARDLLAKALETEAKYEAYLKNNPNDADARATYNTNRQWIDYYKKFIANYENAIANSVPPQ